MVPPFYSNFFHHKLHLPARRSRSTRRHKSRLVTIPSLSPANYAPTFFPAAVIRAHRAQITSTTAAPEHPRPAAGTRPPPSAPPLAAARVPARRPSWGAPAPTAASRLVAAECRTDRHGDGGRWLTGAAARGSRAGLAALPGIGVGTRGGARVAEPLCRAGPEADAAVRDGDGRRRQVGRRWPCRGRRGRRWWRALARM